MSADSRSPLRFFAALYGVSVPFWVLGTVTPWQPVPGVPISAAMFVCPCAVAILLVWREGRGAAVRALLLRSLDYRRMPKRWLGVGVALMPLVMLLSYWTLQTIGRPLPPVEIGVARAPALFGAFLVTATLEQVGWSGYALEPLQARLGALRASVVLGLVWAAWHLIPLLQAGRTPDWIAWWVLMTIALRVLQSWLYNGAGSSVAAAALLQASANTSWQLFPNRGSHYDPQVTGLLLAAIAAGVVGFTGATGLSSPMTGATHSTSAPDE
ncbi:MAG: CPBP family glutamic-type intramembrane protease [Gemmatimonadaceae bacterium]|jgi:hypothetical protein|nr:CPBP family glutamic-type intramembrane protease [Gemmatimonadaceae bacterium]